MSVEVTLGTPLAETLQNNVQSKLMEAGWSTGGLDDTSLAEYIVLMLANGKTREEIASELSTDLLQLDPQDASVLEFSSWLFEQVQSLSAQANEATHDSQVSQPQPSTSQGLGGELSSAVALQDAEMGDATDGQDIAVPTGPKSMRNAPPRSRDKRILGQVHKAMDRSNDGVLHRIKGAAGAGRINSHSREPPKGPTPKGPRATMQRSLAQGGPSTMNNMSINSTGQGNMFGSMTPQQQMRLFAMYEEQARMMAQILSPQQQQQMFPNQMALNQNGAGMQQRQPGKSLFDRVEHGSGKPNGHFGRNQHNNGPSNATNDTSMADPNDPASSMEVETASQTFDKPDHETTMCRFNLSCTKADCYFVHQSPAAPPGVAIDMTDTCAFGAACKNRKCTGKHPSPAKLAPQRAEQDCKFFPNCTNPNCPFRHPSMPPCRNGADCNVEGCKFSHSKILCKFDPCLNPMCPYKHSEGQKRGSYKDKVWVNPEEGGEEVDMNNSEHVSNRKFVDEDAGEEELILPGKGVGQDAQAGEGVVT